MKSTLLIPTLNEIEALRVIMPQINVSWVDEILFVDGGSTDGTLEYIRELGHQVHSQRGRGFGTAMREGLLRTQNEIIVEFTSDGSSLPEKIPALIGKIREGYDLVIASRYYGDAKSADDTLLTAFGNWMFTALVNSLFGATYTDVLVGYRAYRRSVALSLDLDAAGLSWPCQSSIRFARAGCRVGEIPADEPARIGGVRKMIPHKTGLEILALIARDFAHFENRDSAARVSNKRE